MHRLVLTMVLAAFAFSPAASAAPETGSRVDHTPGSVNKVDPKKAGEAIRAVNQFARCRARQRVKAVEAALSLPFHSDEQGQLIRNLVGGPDDCWATYSVDLRVQPRSLVGPMAEQRVLDRLPAAKAASLVPLTEAQVADAGLAPRNLTEDFAQCVAMKDPATAYALIASKPTGPEEAVLIKRIAPSLGPCIIAGQQVSLNKPGIRTAVSIGLYRLLPLVAPQPSPAAGQ